MTRRVGIFLLENFPGVEIFPENLAPVQEIPTQRFEQRIRISAARLRNTSRINEVGRIEQNYAKIKDLSQNFPKIAGKNRA